MTKNVMLGSCAVSFFADARVFPITARPGRSLDSFVYGASHPQFRIAMNHMDKSFRPSLMREMIRVWEIRVSMEYVSRLDSDCVQEMKDQWSCCVARVGHIRLSPRKRDVVSGPS